MADFDSPVTYYLVSEKPAKNPVEDLEKITRQVATQDDIKINNRTANILDYTYTETPHRVLITLDTDKSLNRYFKITCENQDNITINFLKIFVDDLGYRVFNPMLGCFIPASTDLVDLTTFPIDLETQTIFNWAILKPIFMFRNSQVYYAQNGNGEVFLINRHLLATLRERGVENLPPRRISDFATKICSDLPLFIALFDRGVVPISFYETIHNGFLIMNHSGFNPDHLESDIAVNLITLKLDRVQQKFVADKKLPDRRLTLEKGTSLISQLEKFICLKLAKDITYSDQYVPTLTATIFLSHGSDP